MTKQGLKAIEDIQVGDQVLSYNDNLEIFEYKDVVEVYNNETTELCHIHTENEEIVCTPNHSILTSEGWKLANELTTKDNIKTSNGYVQVKSIEIEHLKEELHVYNLNVLGYHTYVVGNELFVLHNECANVDLDEPKELHHIVEQCQQKPNRSGFTKEQVNRHVKYLKKSDHRKVFRLYSSKGKLDGVDYAAKLKIDTSGKRIRDWLNGQSFEAQLEFGREVLKMFNIK